MTTNFLQSTKPPHFPLRGRECFVGLPIFLVYSERHKINLSYVCRQVLLTLTIFQCTWRACCTPPARMPPPPPWERGRPAARPSSLVRNLIFCFYHNIDMTFFKCSFYMNRYRHSFVCMVKTVFFCNDVNPDPEGPLFAVTDPNQ